MRAVILVAVCGCRFGFDPFGGSGSGSADAPKAAIDAPVLALDAGQCPVGYTANMGCYRLGTANAGWLAAELACEADAVGAHMVVIDDATEQMRITATFALVGHSWIGTSKRTTSAYRTVIDTAAFLDLGVPQSEPSEDCLSLDATDGKMYLHSCPDVNRYFCEYDGKAAVPGSY